MNPIHSSPCQTQYFQSRQSSRSRCDFSASTMTATLHPTTTTGLVSCDRMSSVQIWCEALTTSLGAVSRLQRRQAIHQNHHNHLMVRESLLRSAASSLTSSASSWWPSYIHPSSARRLRPHQQCSPRRRPGARNCPASDEIMTMKAGSSCFVVVR